jgi:hypothetical protein
MKYIALLCYVINRYDSKTGIFHCDEAGLYVFQLSMVAVPGSYVTAQIAKNHQGEAWAFAMDPTNSSSGGTMVILKNSSLAVVAVSYVGSNVIKDKDMVIGQVS